jgi:hypothetical protein
MTLPAGVAVSPSDGNVVIRLNNISATYSVAEARTIATAILQASAAAPTQRHLAIHGKLDAPQRPRWDDIPKTTAEVSVNQENAA